jgi:chemotaxis protein methyltransferase CheR
MIPDDEGIQFLQWCLPKLHLRWSGFRKVRRQVYKRLNRRCRDLGLSGVSAYRSYLESHPDEWFVLDACCRIFITCFYRDKGVFQFVERVVLPEVARLVVRNGEKDIRCWSAGCASGEEPFTLTILWKERLGFQFPTLHFQVVATDVNPQMLHRAERSCYPASSVKDLPQEWLARAFLRSEAEFCLKPMYRQFVTFVRQDIRNEMPEGRFHLILCRNLAFTYFDDLLQREILQRLTEKLVPGGALIIGKLESFPNVASALTAWAKDLRVYRNPL